MPKKPLTQEQLLLELEDTRARLDEAEEALRAIHSGEADGLIVSGADGEQIFTLKSADHSYRTLIEDMSEGALTLTAEGIILYANRRFAEMLKTPLEKVIGSTIHTWIAPDSQRILQSLLRKGVDGKRREQLMLTAGDGTQVPVNLSVSNPLVNEMPDYFCLVATDLTEQKRRDAIVASEKLAQELLAASDQSRLELLSVVEDQKRVEEALRKSQHLLDARTRIASAFLSSSAEDIYGDVLDIVLSIMQSEFGAFGYIDEHGDYIVPSMTRHIWDKCRVPEKDIRFPRDTWGDSLWCQAIREKRTVHSNQPSVKVPAGHIPIHRYVAVPIVYQGEVIGLLQVANKETDYDAGDTHMLETISDVIAPILNTRLQRDREGLLRIEAEGAVKEAEKRYREIFEGTSEGILVADIETRRFRYCNPAICEMLGYSEEELMELEVTEIHPKESLDHVLATFEAQTRGDKVLAPSLPCLRKDGSVIYADIHATSVVIDGREHNVGFFTDVTKRIHIEAQLRQAQKMEAIGTLAGGVAHDFNNLLTTIIGNVDLGLMDLGKDHLLREGLEEIKKAANRATTLTHQLLAFSRKQIVQPKILDLNKILTGIEKMLVRLIVEDIVILIIPKSDLWKIEIDPGQMEQVIMNLMVNARDAMPMGGKLTVETANVDLNENYFIEHGIKKQPGSYVVTSISDTGSGMDKETQEHIFEPFYTTKEQDKGTGLGLSTVYGIVKQNKGFIWVYSEPEQGTTFKVYLPKVERSVDTEEKELSPMVKLDGSETVLVAEDDDSLRKIAQKSLDPHGYRILVAENGEDALRVSKEHEGTIDLLIADVVMPKMGGKEVAERLQPLYPRMKVIYMSGYTDDSIAHHGVLAPGLNFLEKPFSPEGLVRKVREVLDKK
ncbi:PAS domain S-box protein [Thermodesulfobacteriota bacterium]